MVENQMTQSGSLWTPSRIIATVVVAVLIATVGYTLFGGRTEVKTTLTVALPGTPISTSAPKSIPPDFEVRTLDGSTFKLSNYRGRVVVVDFWATWCPPCREEVPQLVRVAKQNRDRGIEVIGLHIDDRGRSTPDAIRKFISQYDINYTVGIATDDMFLAYLGEEDNTIPQTMVFDRNGNAVAKFIGYDQSHARELDEAINHALAGS